MFYRVSKDATHYEQGEPVTTRTYYLTKSGKGKRVIAEYKGGRCRLTAKTSSQTAKRETIPCDWTDVDEEATKLAQKAL